MLMARLDNLGKGASGAAVQCDERAPAAWTKAWASDRARPAVSAAGRRAVVVGVGVGEAEPPVDRPRRRRCRLDLQVGRARAARRGLREQLAAQQRAPAPGRAPPAR